MLSKPFVWRGDAGADATVIGDLIADDGEGGGGLAVVCDLLMGDADVVKAFQCLCGLRRESPRLT